MKRPKQQQNPQRDLASAETKSSLAKKQPEDPQVKAEMLA
jgi:hypothetical protein